MQMNGVIYTVVGAARAVGCAEDTVRRAARAGVIPDRRDTAGRRIFFDADIETLRHHLRNYRRKTSANLQTA
jgi:DNA-binding transcriptional MerR regulator